MKASNIIVLILAIILGTGFYVKYNKVDLPQVVTNILEITRLKNRYEATKVEYDYDLIIVGSGLAGLTAAFEADKLFEGKKKILVIESSQKFGGNSAKATSGINILDSPLQKKEKVEDSFELFYNDTMRSGKNLGVPELVSTVVEDSHYLYDFFTKEVKADLTKLGLLGGHSVARTHRPTNATIGYHLVSTLYNILKNIPSITFIFNSTVNELITDKNKNQVKGVKYYNENDKNKIISLLSKGVILATGGFGHDFDSDDSLLKEFAPQVMNFPTTNAKQTKGIGVKIGRKIGIGLIGMKEVQIHPTGFVNLDQRFEKHKILAPELLRGVGGILINQKGERFVDELGTRDFVSKKIIENCDLVNDGGDNKNTVTQYESFMLINQKAIDTYGGAVSFYIKKGYLRKYDTLKEFVGKMNMTKYYNNLIRTLEEYNKAYDEKKDKFGKKVFPVKFDINDYIYGGIITPSIHYCMGGLTMNKNGELLKADGKVMNGLYGAGEVTGGVHGGNRLGGNSLMECGVYGRRAARAAVNFINTFEK